LAPQKPLFLNGSLTHGHYTLFCILLQGARKIFVDKIRNIIYKNRQMSSTFFFFTRR
jgi:hypothetical protein